MEENEKQNITLAIINEKIVHLCEQLDENKEDHTTLKETLRWQEEKRCKKNDLILETINKHRGELDSKMEQLKDRMFTKNDYDMFIASNNGKLRMIDDRITKTERKIDKVWQYLTIAGAVIFAIWQFGQTLLVEFFKKKI